MNFSAIDVETANPDLASIWQVGIAEYAEGKLVDEWVSYINPEDWFSPINRRIGGVCDDTIKVIERSPTIKEVAAIIHRYLHDKVVVSHTAFDRAAIRKAFGKHNLTPPQAKWLDSARIARKAWCEYSKSGYGLANLCSQFGYSFKHHDALEDAKAAGFILIKAIEESGIPIEEWHTVLQRPASAASGKSRSIARQGDTDGALFGNSIVFTGALSKPRKEAAEIAARMGCNVQDRVNKSTTILVVGNQDIRKLMGKGKSRKYLRAEELIMNGQAIRIISEEDFESLVLEG